MRNDNVMEICIASAQSPRPYRRMHLLEYKPITRITPLSARTFPNVFTSINAPSLSSISSATQPSSLSSRRSAYETAGSKLDNSSPASWHELNSIVLLRPMIKGIVDRNIDDWTRGVSALNVDLGAFLCAPQHQSLPPQTTYRDERGHCR